MGTHKNSAGAEAEKSKHLCIKKAVSEIDESSYLKVLQKLAERKWVVLRKETNLFTRMQKTRLYLLQKGFESGPINLVLKQLCDKI